MSCEHDYLLVRVSHSDVGRQRCPKSITDHYVLLMCVHTYVCDAHELEILMGRIDQNITSDMHYEYDKSHSRNRPINMVPGIHSNKHHMWCTKKKAVFLMC